MRSSNPFTDFMLEKASEEYGKLLRGEKVDLFKHKVYNNQSSSIQDNIYNMNLENNTEETELGFNVRNDRELIELFSNQLVRLRELSRSRERSLAITKLEEARMWLNADCDRLIIESSNSR